MLECKGDSGSDPGEASRESGEGKEEGKMGAGIPTDIGGREEYEGVGATGVGIRLVGTSLTRAALEGTAPAPNWLLTVSVNSSSSSC